MRIFRPTVALLATPFLLAAAPPADELEWYETEAALCFQKLENVLDAAGYTHTLVIDWDESSPSIVDATEALARRDGVEVALLWDGDRMHAVAPFLSHRRARNLVRYAEARDDHPLFAMCLFARAVQEDAGERAFQRSTLAGIAVSSMMSFAFIFIWFIRTQRLNTTSSRSRGRDQQSDRPEG